MQGDITRYTRLGADRGHEDETLDMARVRGRAAQRHAGLMVDALIGVVGHRRADMGDGGQMDHGINPVHHRGPISGFEIGDGNPFAARWQIGERGSLAQWQAQVIAACQQGRHKGATDKAAGAREQDALDHAVCLKPAPDAGSNLSWGARWTHLDRPWVSRFRGQTISYNQSRRATGWWNWQAAGWGWRGWRMWFCRSDNAAHRRAK